MELEILVIGPRLAAGGHGGNTPRATGRNRGLGTEATRLIVGYGFERLGLHRISLEVYAFNPRARRAYEKAGFQVEGVLRQSFRYEDQWIDAIAMSILAPEWPPAG